MCSWTMPDSKTVEPGTKLDVDDSMEGIRNQSRKCHVGRKINPRAGLFILLHWLQISTSSFVPLLPFYECKHSCRLRIPYTRNALHRIAVTNCKWFNHKACARSHWRSVRTMLLMRHCPRNVTSIKLQKCAYVTRGLWGVFASTVNTLASSARPLDEV